MWTVRPGLRFAVSRRLRDEFANGRVDYERDGREIRLLVDGSACPGTDLLTWHEAEIFRDRW